MKKKVKHVEFFSIEENFWMQASLRGTLRYPETQQGIKGSTKNHPPSHLSQVRNLESSSRALKITCLMPLGSVPPFPIAVLVYNRKLGIFIAPNKIDQ